MNDLARFLSIPAGSTESGVGIKSGAFFFRSLLAVAPYAAPSFLCAARSHLLTQNNYADILEQPWGVRQRIAFAPSAAGYFMGESSKVWKELVGLLLFEALRWLVLLLFSALLAHLLTLVLTTLQPLAHYRWELFSTIFTGIFASLIITYRTFGRHRPRFPSLDCDFHIQEKTITYQYTSPSDILYKKRVVLKVLRNNVDRYTDKFHWTGKHVTEISTADQEQRVELTERKNIFQLYDVRFPKACHKGETVTTEVIWRLGDQDRLAVPFVSATIDEPTDKLTFKLTFAKSLGVTQIICGWSADISATKEFRSHIEPVDSHDSACWEILKPKLQHYYEAKWNCHEKGTA